MKKLLYALIFIVVLLHFITLSISPLPWFDEVFFASLAQNFWENGTFYVPVTVIVYEVKIYGFVYFLFAGISQHIGNHSLMSFRIVNFCAGLAVAFWLSFQSTKRSLSTEEQRDKFKNFWICLMFLLDPFFTLCLHEGRMDLLATFFIYVSFYFLQNPQKQGLAGVFALLALLTTPRVAFMGIGMGIYWVGQARKFKRTTLYAPLVVMVGYSFWVWIAFGSVASFLQHYAQGTSAHKLSAWSWYVGGSGYIPRHQYFLLVLLGLSALVYYVKACLPTQTKNEAERSNFSLLWAKVNSIPTIMWIFVISFHVFVHDLGQYSIFILPAYYMLLQHYVQVWGKHAIVIWSFLLAFNALYFSMKTTQVFLSREIRQAILAEEFVRKNIPTGSKVVGEAMYYYAVRQNKCAYQMFEVYEDLPDREKIQREKFGYQYIIVTEHSAWRHKEIVDYYLKQNPQAKKIASLHIPISPTAQWFTSTTRLSPTENTGYNAVIYKIW
jgi:hypothetical protein